MSMVSTKHQFKFGFKMGKTIQWEI